MDLDELTAVLAGPPRPDRGEVLASFRRKHHRRKVRRRLVCAGGAAAGLAVTIALVTAGQSRPSGLVAGSPAGCTQTSLAQSLARARHAGASILIASESPAGRMSGSGFAPVVLRSVQTLSGPAVTSGTIAWTDGAAIGGTTSPASSGTGATGGRVFAIAWPASLAGSAVGPVLRAAPVVGGNVIFTASGCTGVADLPVPASGALGRVVSGTGPAAMYAVPLRTVVEAAASSRAESKEGDPRLSPSTAPRQGSDQSRGNSTGKQGGGGKSPKAGSPATAAPASATQASSSQSGNGKGKGKANGKANGHGNRNGNG